jgi:hypothetical protein
MQQVLRYGSHVSLTFVLALGLVLALQPTDAAWWFIRIPGVVAFTLTVAALIFPVSPEKPERHRLLGWLAFVALSAHIVLGAALEPTLWQWLSPSVPVEIVAGLVAAVALFTTLGARRSHTLRRGFGPLAAFGIHRIAGTVASAAAGAHIALISGMTISVILLTSASLVAALAVVLGRENRLLSLAVVLVIVTSLVAILAIEPLPELRLASLRNSPIDHARFSHSDHGGYACTACHHNFIDLSGKENCISCHKRLTKAEPMRVDRLFHVFCSDCHRNEKRAGRKMAPIDRCMGCHQTG